MMSEGLILRRRRERQRAAAAKASKSPLLPSEKGIDRSIKIVMAKRRAKRVVKKSIKDLGTEEEEEEPEIQEQTQTFKDHEVERRIAVSQAIRDAEIEHLLTGLRLLRSNFNKEQLQTPVLQFFKENMPNLMVKTSEDGRFEVEWKEEDGKLSISHVDERNMHASLLQRMSMAYPHCTAAMPATSGFEFSSKGEKTILLGATNFQIPDFVMEEPSETQMHGFQDSFQTPGVNSQRLSMGMTPKTLRLPKNGEMLLSVRGSPLGMYKEDNNINMEVINESEEG